MKNKKFLILFSLLGLLTACNSKDLPLPYGDDEIDDIVNDFSDTPWTDYSVPATAVTFADGEEEITLNKGETHNYQFTISPKEATSAALCWTSLDTDVATIDNGLLTAVGGGETKIIVSSPVNSFENITLNVIVNVPLTSFSISPSGTMECDLNRKYTFTPSFVPEDTTFTELNWSIPEEQQSIATVEDGVVTTYSAEGSVIMTVTSDYLPGVSETITLNVYDRTKHVTSITLSGENRVELGKQIQLTADVEPKDADALLGGIQYYSKNPEIATIDINTGLVTGVSTGRANIYAVCELTSADFAIDVYEINADELQLTETAPIALSNDETHQLSWAFKNNNELVTPTNDAVTFGSSDRNVASVSATGLITAVAKGSATITISHLDSVNGLLSDTIDVNVTIVAKSLIIRGSASMYNDSSTTLNVTLVPSDVSDPTVSYSASPAELVDLTPIGNGVEVAAKGINGTVTITATNGEISGTHTIEITDRPVVFITGDMYIVGTSDFSKGVSTPVEGGSWLNAKYAYHFVNECASEDPTMDIQYKGTIVLNAGDEWRYVYGGMGNSQIWVPGYEGDNPDYHIENNGALIDGSMSYADSSNPESNIVVNQAGSYDFYAKRYQSGWYALYVQKTPTLSVDNNNVTISIGGTEQIVAHNYTGTVTYASNDTTVATVDSTGLITGVKKGQTTITVSDDLNSVLVNVNVTDLSLKTIYLNANGIFDFDGAVPFIHSFNTASEGTDFLDSKMTLVSGQTIVYSANIPETHDGVVFVRMPAGSTSLDWDTKWNQSADLTYDTNDMWTASGFDGEGVALGTWSVFDPDTIYEVPVATTKTITIVSNATYSSDGAWFAIWAWKKGGAGTFYYGDVIGYSYYINVPKECDCYIVLRMVSGVDAASISEFPQEGSQYYNKTGDMEDISGTTFTITGWGLDGYWS